LCEVHVLTTHEFKTEIERLVAAGTLPSSLHFHFFDIPSGRWVWRHPTGFRIRLHYPLWQRAAGSFVRSLHAVERFDSAQHVTFVRYWGHSCLADSGIPYIFGPVGGAEFVPRGLLGGFSVGGRCFDLVRNAVRAVSERLPSVRRTIRNARFVLTTTRLTGNRIELIRGTKEGVLQCGESALTERERKELDIPHETHAEVVFCGLGRLVPLKRYDLAVKAFARANVPGSRLRLVGGGSEENSLRRIADSLGVGSRVEITGFLLRSAALQELAFCDVLLHPSTHDSGGWACIEGMAAGLPVICLDWGGPGTQVTDETGFRIPVGDENEVVAKMADAMRCLADAGLRSRMSAACKGAVRNTFNWGAKASVYIALHRSIGKGGNNG
jgi:glycosyltransferase involved in cell wall biosynthesis